MSSSVGGELSFSPRFRYAGGGERTERAQQRHGTEGGRVCEAVRTVVSRKTSEPDPNGTDTSLALLAALSKVMKQKPVEFVQQGGSIYRKA